jgi:ribosome biogenesis GTPase
MELEYIGWKQFFEAQYEPLKNSGLVPGRVTGIAGPVYKVETGQGSGEARVSGRFQYTAVGREDYPATGDWVLLSVNGNAFVIEKVLDRSSSFSRKTAGRTTERQVIAANIDIMFITSALDGGRNFTLRGIERYIVMVREGGAEPVLLLNKCDLCSDREGVMAQARSVAGNVPVYMVSALTGEGLPEIISLVERGVTAAFTGPSGAGKSALVNAFHGYEKQRTGALREHDLRGRHTTTGSELFMLPSGGLVIDTAGLRELTPFGDESAADEAFPEIAAVTGRCRFTDCTHSGEPGCAVYQLVLDGMIDQARYENYISIRKEMAYLNSSGDMKAMLDRKARDKALSKLVKNYMKGRK